MSTSNNTTSSAKHNDLSISDFENELRDIYDELQNFWKENEDRLRVWQALKDLDHLEQIKLLKFYCDPPGFIEDQKSINDFAEKEFGGNPQKAEEFLGRHLTHLAEQANESREDVEEHLRDIMALRHFLSYFPAHKGWDR